MKLFRLVAVIFLLIQFNTKAENINYALDFGLIIHNDIGEPVGFEKTTQIPILEAGNSSLYGVVVTSPDNNEFILNSIHILPAVEANNIANKVIGKSMIIQKRGAILLRTDTNDQPGRYAMEIYIDSKLHQTLNYELITETELTRL